MAIRLRKVPGAKQRALCNACWSDRSIQDIEQKRMGQIMKQFDCLPKFLKMIIMMIKQATKGPYDGDSPHKIPSWW